jgi:integrase
MKFGTDVPGEGKDPLEFCCLCEKERTGLDDMDFDGDPADYIFLLFRSYRDELELALRHTRLANKTADIEPCECTKGKCLKPSTATSNTWTCLKCGKRNAVKPRSGKAASRSTLQLIESLPRGSDRRVACMTMIHAGLRLAEVLAMTWRDCEVEPGMLAVQHGKGDKYRVVPISKALEGELLALLKAHKAAGAVHTDDKVIQYNRSALQKWLDRHQINAHSLRHACAYEWGKVLARDEIAVLLGHSSTRTTEIYTHPNANDIARKLGWSA